MPKYNIGEATWDCSSTLTHRFWWNGFQKAIMGGVSTSSGIRTTTNPKKSTEPSTSEHPFSPLLQYQSQRLNSGEHFIMQKRVRRYASPWKKWVGSKAQPRSLWTITQRAEFATAQSNDNDRDQWTANFLVDRSGKFEHIPYSMGTRARKSGRLFHKTFCGSSPS